MSYLIDTNVLSELRRKHPDAGVEHDLVLVTRHVKDFVGASVQSVVKFS